MFAVTIYQIDNIHSHSGNMKWIGRERCTYLVTRIILAYVLITH